MKRLFLAAALAVGFVGTAPAHAAGTHSSTRPSALSVLHPSGIAARHLVPRTAPAAFPHQVQNGKITSSQQLRLPSSVMTAGGQLSFDQGGDEPMSPAQADANTLQGIYLHPNVTYEQFGALGLYYEETSTQLGDGTFFFLTYLGSYYGSAEGAQAAFNDATSGWSSLSPTTCQVPSSTATHNLPTQCLEVTFTPQNPAIQDSAGNVYRVRLRVVQISNALFEYGAVMEQTDLNSNSATVDQILTDISSSIVALFNASSPPPTPNPTPNPTPRPTPSPTPSPTPTPVKYTLTARWEKANANPSLTGKALKKVKKGKTVQVDSYVDVSSAPPAAPVTIDYAVSKGGKVVASTEDNVQLSATDPTGWYPDPKEIKLKKPATYTLNVRVSVSGVVETASAKLKVTK
jgi:hypothetical protein